MNRLTRFFRRQRLDAGVVVVARVNRVHMDVGVLLLKIRNHAVDHFGQRAADGNRIVHREFDGLGARRGGPEQRQDGGGAGRGLA